MKRNPINGELEKCPECLGDTKALIHSLGVCDHSHEIDSEQADYVSLRIGLTESTVVLKVEVTPANGAPFACQLGYTAEEASSIALTLAKAAHDLNKLQETGERPSGLVTPPSLKLRKSREEPKQGSVLSKAKQRRR